MYKKQIIGLVSVIIPTYNQPGFLVQAIESVLKQTYKNYEIIVIDDGSTDNTKEILDSYIKNRKIKYVYQNNKRQAAARNTGILNSKGEFIAFLDHDDLWLPKKLELQVPLFKDKEVALVYTNSEDINSKGKTIKKRNLKYCGGYIFKDLLKRHFITNSSVIIRKECLRKTGLFREDLYGADDIHLWLRISHNFKIEHVPRVLIRYRFHENNMINQTELHKEQVFKCLADIYKRYNLRKHLKRLFSKYHFNKGYNYRKTKRLKALYFYMKAMSYLYHPIQIKAIKKLFIPGYYKK